MILDPKVLPFRITELLKNGSKMKLMTLYREQVFKNNFGDSELFKYMYQRRKYLICKQLRSPNEPPHQDLHCLSLVFEFSMFYTFDFAFFENLQMTILSSAFGN